MLIEFVLSQSVSGIANAHKHDRTHFSSISSSSSSTLC